MGSFLLMANLLLQKTKLHVLLNMVSCNGQFPLRDSSAGNHGSCIHQNNYPVEDDEDYYMHHDSRYVHLIERNRNRLGHLFI